MVSRCKTRLPSAAIALQRDTELSGHPATFGGPASARKPPEARNSDHKVWGSVEFASSCDSDSIDMKLARAMESATIMSQTDDSSSAATRSDCEPRRAAEEAAREAEEAEEEVAVEENDPRLATEGSSLHASGQCKPCYFFQAGKGCTNGSSCRFCHYHTGTRRKRPGRRERAKMAQRAAGSRDDPSMKMSL